jgi:hypothetical protein
LLLMLFAVWSAGTGQLLAQNRLGDILPEPSSCSQPPAPSVWLDDTRDPLFRRLPPPDAPPPPDDLLIDDFVRVDEPQADPFPRGGPFGAAPGDGSPGDGGRAPFTARLFWIPQQDLKNQPGDLAVNGEEIELAFPLRIAPDGIWLALASVQRLEISTSAVLPDSGLPVPNQLWDIEVGTMHLRELANGWRAGGMLRVGSPSDQPFAALRDMTVTLLGFLTVPSGERDAWSFSLFYSPTGQIVFPIPGIAYRWRPSPQFQADLGIPFSLQYRPTETLTLSASYRPLTDVQVLVRQSLGESWSVYGGYRTVNETFLLADRSNDRERTYIFDQRLTLGATRELGRNWSLDLSSAYVFDRHVFQAEKFSGSRRDELTIDPGFAGTLQLLWTR